MARYCLLLKCVLDPNNAKGEFVNDADYPMWVSPDVTTSDKSLWKQDPDLTPLSVNVGDTVNFAVKVVDLSGNLVPLVQLSTSLLVVVVSAKGSRSAPDANSFSPFRFNGAVQVLKLAGNGFDDYLPVSANGLHEGGTYEYLGFDYGRGDATVVDDGRQLSQWEFVVCFYTQPSLLIGGGFYQFSYDPEMDTQKGGGK